MLCPKGHTLMPKTVSVTEVPAFCNFCFKHVVQTCWSGDVKYCSVETCCFTICATCLKSLSANSENRSSLHSCVQREAVSSLKVQFCAPCSHKLAICWHLVFVFRNGLKYSMLSIFFREFGCHGFIGSRSGGPIIIVTGPRNKRLMSCFDQEL